MAPLQPTHRPRSSATYPVLAEREAIQHLRDARAHLAALVFDAVTAGAHYDELARQSIRTTTGRSATLDERRREVDRLRQVVRRHRMTARHEIDSCKIEVAPPSEARSDGKEDTTMEKLIKRTTIEETFSINGTDKHPVPDDLDDRDEVEVDDDDDEDDKAARKARRR